MEPTIRPARPEDLSEIERIEELCFPVPWSKASIEAELAPDSRRLALVIDAGDRLLGFAFVWVIADELHLVSLAVDPSARRQGWGQALLDAILDFGEARGAALVTLEVRISNQAARALYRGNGFLEVALRPRYYPDSGEDAVVMVKPLNQN